MTTSKKFVKSLLKNQTKAIRANINLPSVSFGADEDPDTLDLLLESLSFAYKEDTTKPGVLISKVNKGSRVYYASVLRFSNGSKERTVVVSATGSNKNEALEKLAQAWLKLQKPKHNPIDELKEFLGV